MSRLNNGRFERVQMQLWTQCYLNSQGSSEDPASYYIDSVCSSWCRYISPLQSANKSSQTASFLFSICSDPLHCLSKISCVRDSNQISELTWAYGRFPKLCCTSVRLVLHWCLHKDVNTYYSKRLCLQSVWGELCRVCRDELFVYWLRVHLSLVSNDWSFFLLLLWNLGLPDGAVQCQIILQTTREGGVTAELYLMVVVYRLLEIPCPLCHYCRRRLRQRLNRRSL